MKLLDAALSLFAWPPRPIDWPIYGHWPAFYYDKAPDAVVDFCGGTRANTTWSQLSEPCGLWVVKMLKCQQGCRPFHWMSGFGTCMNDCAGRPDPSWCELPDVGMADESIKEYCRVFMKRWETCNISTHLWQAADEWHVALDNCVYSCDDTLEVQRNLGQRLSWRPAKCTPKWFACDAGSECAEVDRSHCKYPLGIGNFSCFFDDMTCENKCGDALLSEPAFVELRLRR